MILGRGCVNYLGDTRDLTPRVALGSLRVPMFKFLQGKS